MVKEKKIDSVREFRMFVLHNHLNVELRLNAFISKYIFRCASCKNSLHQYIDGMSGFDELILSKLSFNTKKTIVFDKILCGKHRGTFDRIAIVKSTELHKKEAKEIGKLVVKLNEFRNQIAHQFFLFDEEETMQNFNGIETNENRATYRRILNQSRSIVNVEKDTADIAQWSEKIEMFFDNISFKKK